MFQLLLQNKNHYVNERRYSSDSAAFSAIEQLTSDLSVIENENSTLRQILAGSPSAILITNAEVKIIYANRAWEKLTGYTLDEVRGENPRILKSGKTPHDYYKNLWKALSSGKPFISEKIIDKRKDGSLYNIYSTTYPVQEDGKITYYVQVQHDITERVQLDKLKSEFLSVASHELKTPITVLKLLSQSRLAQAQKRNSVMMTKEDLEMFDQELDRITNLINDILDNTRIENGKMRMNFEIFDITALTQATVENIRILKKQHKLVTNPTTSPYMVVGDKQRIEQVLLNFLMNAVKYSPDGSVVSVGINEQKSHVVVSVKDQGIGIAPKDLKSIFDKFYQVKNRDGFGLGLYISKEIIKRHKGKIWAESEERKGSTFFFSLPLQMK